MVKYAIIMLSNSCPEGYEYEYYTHYEIRNNYIWTQGVYEIEKAKLFNSIEDAEKELFFIQENDTFNCLLHIIVVR